ncbi:MAG TPA: hypothetical protein VN673_10600, partial [Clostridia bacterium]|nr:hypothetical protein [Clostridia bacterium]
MNPTSASVLGSRLSSWLLSLLVGAAAPVALGKTWVIPHVLEKSGLIADTQYTFDTTLFLTYNGSLHGTDSGSVQVAVYLYDQSGQLMRGSAAEVCGPCQYKL